MNTLTEVQKAYLAGMIDADGVVTFVKARTKSKGKRSVTRWRIGEKVLVTNTDAALLQILKGWTGIGCVYHSKKPPRDGWALVHRWQITHRQARHLLRAVLPYMLIKRERAELVLSLPKMHKAHFDPDIHAAQLALCARIRALNNRGKHRADQRPHLYDTSCFEPPPSNPTVDRVVRRQKKRRAAGAKSD